MSIKKRFGDDEQEKAVIDEYPNTIKQIQEYYKKVVNAVPSLIEIRSENQKKKRREYVTQYVIPIAGIIIGIIIAVLF